MTREEAIERFENVKANALVQKASGVSAYWQNEIDGTVEAIDMAIEALQADALLKQEIDFHKKVSRIEADKVVDLEHKLADMVSVVRCKDCRHGQYDATHYFCAEHYHKVYEDDYCSHGERRCNYFGERREP